MTEEELEKLRVNAETATREYEEAKDIAERGKLKYYEAEYEKFCAYYEEVSDECWDFTLELVQKPIANRPPVTFSEDSVVTHTEGIVINCLFHFHGWLLAKESLNE